MNIKCPLNEINHNFSSGKKISHGSSNYEFKIITSPFDKLNIFGDMIDCLK